VNYNEGPPVRGCDCEVCERRRARYAQIVAKRDQPLPSGWERPVMPPTDTEMLDYIEETLCISRDSIRNAMKSRQWSRT
jgi:hypothetical protein